MANWPIGVRGNRGDDHSQLFGKSKVVGQANKQSETFWNTVGPKAEEWKALESERLGMRRTGFPLIVLELPTFPMHVSRNLQTASNSGRWYKHKGQATCYRYSG